MKRILLTSALFAATHAGAEEVNCPAQLSVTAQANAVPAGWESFQPTGPHTFDHLSVYYLHPRELGSQVPDNEGTKQPPEWRFADGQSEAYWVACEYHGTDTVLTQRLPAGLKRCAATTTGLRCR